MTEPTDPLDNISEAIVGGAVDDISFGALAHAIFRYLVHNAPPRQVSMFMDLATGLRKELMAKDLAHKAATFLALHPNPTEAQVRELATLTPEQVSEKLLAMGDEDRRNLGKMLSFPGPRAVPNEGA